MYNKSFLMISTIALALAPAVAAPPDSNNGKAAKEGQQIIVSLEHAAVNLDSEADQFKMVADGYHYGKESHGEDLMAMKEEINRMGREIATLEREQDALPGWEQQVVIKTLPLLKDAAASTESAIKYLNQNSYLWTPEYRTYADRVCQDSEQMVKTLKAYLKMAELHHQERELEVDLGE